MALSAPDEIESSLAVKGLRNYNQFLASLNLLTTDEKRLALKRELEGPRRRHVVLRLLSKIHADERREARKIPPKAAHPGKPR
jgi:hypothetical protein